MMNAGRTISTMAVFGGLLALWALVSALGWVNAFLLPPPARIWSAFLELSASGRLWDHLLVSLGRVGAGYLLAAALALSLGVLVVSIPGMARIVDPLLDFLRQVPPLALMPLALLWLGIGEAQKLGIIVLSCFFPIFLGLRGGFAQVDPRLIEVGRAAGFGRAEILRRIAIPAALPAVVVGMRLGLGYGWRALVGAELIASSAGLGYMILDAQDMARTDIVLVGVLMIGLIGLVSDWLLRRAVGWWMPWIRQEMAMGNG